MYCYNCFYYTGETILPCAVDPITASKFTVDNDCKHYEEAYSLWSDLSVDSEFLSLDVRNLFKDCKHYEEAYSLWSDVSVDSEFLSLDVRNLF